MTEAPDTDAGDLDDQVRRFDPDRWLSSRFVADAQARAGLIALYAFDHELARAPKVASNALLGEIRLTWWGEVLGEIYGGTAVRRHPAAQALAHAISRWDLPREALDAMVEARLRELDPAPMSTDETLAWALGSAGSAARLAAAILDSQAEAAAVAAAGQLWAVALRRLHRAPEAPDLSAAVRRLAPSARKAARRLSGAAFPAIAHAALARPYSRGQAPSLVAKQLRLTWAVARGRI